MIKFIRLSSVLLAILPSTLPLVAKDLPSAKGAPTAESFARLSPIRHVNISPDGKTIAYSVVDDRKVSIAFKDIATGKVSGAEGGPGSNAYYPEWVSDKRVVYGHLAAIDRDGNNYKGVLGYPRFEESHTEDHLFTGYRIFTRFTDSREGNVLMTEYDQPLSGGRYSLWMPTFPHVLMANSRNGTFGRVVDNPGNVVSWMTDAHGNVRIGVEWHRNGDLRVIYRETEKASWAPLPGLETPGRSIRPLAISPDNKSLYLSKVGANGKWAVYTYDLATHKLSEPIVAHPYYDILPLSTWSGIDGYPLEQVVVAPRSGEVLGIQFITDVPGVVWFNPQMASIQEALDQGLKDHVNTIVDMSDDLKKLVVMSWAANDPGTYYLFDLDQKSLKPLFPTVPWIKPAQMASVMPIKYKARDGVVIHGYLTIPAGKDPKSLPMVVYPHGGPFARDTWHFDHDVQFLASLGYAVLQMNYRGSPGFGVNFEEAGYRKMGTVMQDDITDGTHWAIDQGVADPSRIAIMGWSFGGYSALMGVLREPTLYRCAIDLAGVTSWSEIFNYDLAISDMYKESSAKYMGDPVKDRDELDRQSPVKLIDRLQVPLLAAYSKDDTTVPYEQARLLKDALDKAHKSYEYIGEYNEGHGFYGYESRLNLYRKVEAFLAKNMAPSPAKVARSDSSRTGL